jgi:hypothetical protein
MTQDAERQARLARALRDNLRRRKAATRPATGDAPDQSAFTHNAAELPKA